MEKYENVQDPKKRFPYDRGSFRGHDYLILLSDLSSVKWQKSTSRSLFCRIAARSCFSFAWAAEGFTLADCQGSLTCGRMGRAREVVDMHCTVQRWAHCLGRTPCVLLVAYLWAKRRTARTNTNFFCYSYNVLCNGRCWGLQKLLSILWWDRALTA